MKEAPTVNMLSSLNQARQSCLTHTPANMPLLGKDSPLYVQPHASVAPKEPQVILFDIASLDSPCFTHESCLLDRI